MEKYIKIEWDEKQIKVEHSDGVRTYELFGILEVVKHNLWDKKQPVEKED